MNYKAIFAETIAEALETGFSAEEAACLIERPKQPGHGDLAFPCFTLAKVLRQSPAMIASELAVKVKSLHFEKAEAAGGYVNVFLDKKRAAKALLDQIGSLQQEYGSSVCGKGRTVTIDYSSPNIAKPFSMGHLRSTVIGHSLGLILEKNGYKVIRINHLGDWGTQFGKLISAYKRWGTEERIQQEPIKELSSLYVRFHKEAETDSELEMEGRAWFRKLEGGDLEAHRLWKWFREESLAEFSKTYEVMNIRFDSLAGEAFYNDKMDEVIMELEQKGLLQESEAAQVVMLDGGMPPCLIRKSDGATLYATRDLAAAIYRHRTYGSDIGLYVVGSEQSLHFRQIFAVLAKMGYEWADSLVHIPFGMILKDGKKMSTRKGKVILLDEVLNQSISLAMKNIESRNPALKDKHLTAKQVGVGAILFHDLKNDRQHDLEFSLEDMLRPEGETGPYVQYTNARALSILRKAKVELAAESEPVQPDGAAWQMILQLMEFPEAVSRAAVQYDPSQIAKYTISLAQLFNKYYGEVRILSEDEGLKFRLSLVSAVSLVLSEGLRLLGVEAPSEM